MKTFFLNLILICLCLSPLNAQKLTFDDFKSNLKKDMDNKAIIKTFGRPDSDIGSGIYIYVYKLSDSATMIIGCTDQVLYARHCNKQGDLLHILFGESKLKCNPANLEHTYLALLRPGLDCKDATINDQKIYTVKAGQLILYNDNTHNAWISNGSFGYIPQDDLIKVDTFYFRFDFSQKSFVSDSDDELFIAAQRQGLDINKLTSDVLKKDSKALNNLFLLRYTFDGAAAEIYPNHFWSLLMTWNDKCIADFITNLKVKDRKRFLDYITDIYVTFPIEKPLIYYELYYPETFELISKYQ